MKRSIEEQRELNRIRTSEWRKKYPNKAKASAKKYRENNKEKINEQSRNNRKLYPERYKKYDNKRIRTPEQSKNWDLKKNFGITLDKYNEMLKNQENKCSICNISAEFLKRALCVDHCHTTGKIRGLLCDPCNWGLGNFKDNIKLIDSAKEYLRKYNE